MNKRLNPDELVRTADMIRALGHPIRLRLVEALECGECCVSDLQDAVGQPQAVVSQHLAKMKAAGIVSCRRDGVNVRYVVAEPRVLRMLDCLRHGSAVRSRHPIAYTRDT